jgi:hypothetical protein
MTPTPQATPQPPPPQPTPVVACDLVQSGTCYRRIAGPTLEMFDKTVSPGYTCDDTGTTCQWINAVGSVTISVRESYSIQPPIAPIDPSHRLLYVVDGVAGIYEQCATFDSINTVYPDAPNTILWNSFAILSNAGNLANLNLPPGFGEPDIYAYRNAIVRSGFPISGVYGQYDQDATQYSNTINQFYSAVDAPSYGHAVASQYSDPNISQGEYVTYIPDFTDCASGYPDDRLVGDQLYGVTTAAILIETYQAVPQ